MKREIGFIAAAIWITLGTTSIFSKPSMGGDGGGGGNPSSLPDNGGGGGNPGSPADDGGGGGNPGYGGHLWVCREGTRPNGAIRTMKLVDLSDLEDLWHLKTPFKSDAPIDEIMKSVGDRIRAADPVFYAEYQRLENIVMVNNSLVTKRSFEKLKDLCKNCNPDGTVSPQTGPHPMPSVSSIPSDGDRVYISKPAPDTCANGTIRDELLANFWQVGPDGFVWINDILWNDPHLTNLDRAALYVHEAVYRMMREPRYGGDITSENARKIVAFAFSDQPISVWKGQLKIRARRKK